MILFEPFTFFCLYAGCSTYFFHMDVKRLNLYRRLRDFRVPSSVLDGMFDNEDDIQILENAWDALIKDGFQEDEAAKEISAMIFKELNVEPDQLFEDEKESK